MTFVCSFKLSALSFDSAPRNISDSRMAGFGFSVSSFNEKVTSTCLPMYEGGTDTEILVLRGIITVLTIMIAFKLPCKNTIFIENREFFQ
jgi:hypothetical protein